jgi:hypothetical protein
MKIGQVGRSATIAVLACAFVSTSLQLSAQFTPTVKGRVKPSHFGGVKLVQCVAAKLLDLRGRRASGA